MGQLRFWVWTVALLCPAASAQVRVAGRVTNENNLPVGGARVVVADAHGKGSWETISDPGGAFHLQLPAAGQYSLKVDRQGFYVVSEPLVTMPDNPLDTPPFELHIQLQSVHEITSSIYVKREAGSADMDRVTPQTTLSSRTLYDVPFPNRNSLRSGLRMVPGIVQDNAGGIHLFGGSEDQAQYSFEGFQLNDPLTGRFESRMSLEAIESVDVQPSPSDANMGRGDAGTMLLHARTGTDEFKFSVTEVFPSIALGSGLRVSRWTPRVYVAGPWHKGRAWFFNTSEFQFVRTTVPQLPLNENTSASWRFNDLLHSQFNLSERNILFLGLLYDFQYAPRGGLTNLDPRQTTTRRESRQWFGYAKDQHYFSGGSMIEFGFAASLTHSTAAPQGTAPYLITPDGRNGNFFANTRRDAKRYQGIADYRLPVVHLWGEHQVKTGGDIVWLDYQQNITRTSIEYLNKAGAVIRTIGFQGNGALNRDNRQVAGYVQDAWRPRPWLLLEMGWRVDEDRLLGRLNSSPRAGFAFSPPGSERIRLSGSFARVVSPANLQLFTRPLDQSAISTYFDTTGNLIYGPVISNFAPGTNLQNPRAYIWTLGVDRTLPRQLLAKLQLLSRRSSRGFDFTNDRPAPQQLAAILAGAPNPGFVTANYVLTNQRQDEYQSAEISLHQLLKGRYEWTVSFTRSRAESNAVIQRTVDQPLSVSSDSGPLPWDAPNRLLSWGYLPTWNQNWSFAYMLDWHTGLPFSIQDPYGQLVGAVNRQRFPTYFELNLFIERLLSYRGYTVALRVGMNNVTGHFNPTLVDNVLTGSTYLRQYGNQPRALNFQARLLGHR